MTTEAYCLPDLLALLPHKPGGAINPHYKEAEAAFNAWVEKRLGGPRAVEVYECESPLGISRVFPLASYQQLKGIIDYTAAAFMLDDIIDSSPIKSLEAISYMWMKSLRDGSEGESIEHPLIETMRRDLLLGMRQAVGAFHWLQFITQDKKMVMHMVKEAHDRKLYENKNMTLDIQSYLALRRMTVGACVYFVFARVTRSLYISDDVIADPAVQEMENAVADICLIANDIYSFKKEYRFDGAFGNILTVIEKDPKTAYLDFRGRLDYAEKLFKEALERFRTCRKELPSFGPRMDEYLSLYADGLMDIAIGNLQWSRVVRRYNTFASEEDRKKNVMRVELDGTLPAENSVVVK